MRGASGATPIVGVHGGISDSPMRPSGGSCKPALHRQAPERPRAAPSCRSRTRANGWVALRNQVVVTPGHPLRASAASPWRRNARNARNLGPVLASVKTFINQVQLQDDPRTHVQAAISMHCGDHGCRRWHRANGFACALPRGLQSRGTGACLGCLDGDLLRIRPGLRRLQRDPGASAAVAVRYEIYAREVEMAKMPSTGGTTEEPHSPAQATRRVLDKPRAPTTRSWLLSFAVKTSIRWSIGPAAAAGSADRNSPLRRSADDGGGRFPAREDRLLRRS